LAIYSNKFNHMIHRYLFLAVFILALYQALGRYQHEVENSQAMTSEWHVIHWPCGINGLVVQTWHMRSSQSCQRQVTTPQWLVSGWGLHNHHMGP